MTSMPGTRLSKLHPSPVKALVKVDPEVWKFFWRLFAKDAYYSAQQGEKKTLQGRDLDNAIEAVQEFTLLEDT